ncbi:MAG: ATP-binding protein [Actinobacteria bacterium]|nr:ATP-binding protein [Actinomycetota bacterium]
MSRPLSLGLRRRRISGKVGRTTIYQDHDLLELATEATAHNARQLRVRFQEWLRTLGAPAALVDDFSLAVYEALANAAEHAAAHGTTVHMRAALHHSDDGQVQRRPTVAPWSSSGRLDDQTS